MKLLANFFKSIFKKKEKEKKKQMTYKGKKVTDFKAGFFPVFLGQYAAIIKKESHLTSSRRKFVKDSVEKWVEENKINLKEFRDELRY